MYSNFLKHFLRQNHSTKSSFNSFGIKAFWLGKKSQKQLKCFSDATTHSTATLVTFTCLLIHFYCSFERRYAECCLF
jgi:hypothetical protein